MVSRPALRLVTDPREERIEHLTLRRCQSEAITIHYTLAGVSATLGIYDADHRCTCVARGPCRPDASVSRARPIVARVRTCRRGRARGPSMCGSRYRTRPGRVAERHDSTLNPRRCDVTGRSMEGRGTDAVSAGRIPKACSGRWHTRMSFKFRRRICADRFPTPTRKALL